MITFMDGEKAQELLKIVFEEPEKFLHAWVGKNIHPRKEGRMKRISDAEKSFQGIPSLPATSIHNRVIRGVLQSIKNPDWAANQAVDDFLKEYRNSIEEKPDKEILKAISTREGIEAVVSLHGAAIELCALRNRVDHAGKKLRMAVDNVRLTLEEFEEVDSEVSWGFDAFRLCIVKNDSEKEEAALRRVVEFVRSLADGSAATSIESIRKGALPGEMKEVRGQLGEIKVEKLLADLTEVMAENGDAGRQVVLKICEDAETAKAMVMDEEAPGPLRFLAGIVMSYAKK